jgi:penicillin amidase
MPVWEARAELRFAMEIAEHGPEEANRRADEEPRIPLEVPEGVDYSIITEDVEDALGGFEGGMPDVPLLPEYREMEGAVASIHLGRQPSMIGSNNWTLAPSMTSTGGALVSNDPHRGVTNPSLRYLVRLNAPEWNVIGATEPGIPGVAIGHNGRIGWGLTIVGTDQSDVYIEELNPENPDQVRWQGDWEDLRIEVDTIQVKGADPEIVEDAVAAGCTRLLTATGEAVPGDPQHSYHNIEWAGFEPTYVRDNWVPK